MDQSNVLHSRTWRRLPNNRLQHGAHLLPSRGGTCLATRLAGGVVTIMASSRIGAAELLISLLRNVCVRDFLVNRAFPHAFPYPVTTLPAAKKVFCVPLSTPPVVCGLAVSDSPAGYAFCVVDDNQRVVLLVGECRDGTEVVLLHQGDSAVLRFEGNLFNKFIAGGDVGPVLPGECGKKLPRNGEWGYSRVDASIQNRIQKWASNPGKSACPVALLNGKVRMCRGLAVWELLSGNDVPEQPPVRRFVRLAPAPMPGAAGVVKDVTSEGEEKRRKAELRKARNRESAQRSNMRRKMKLQALKEELERVNLTEKRLRKRERDLREENSELKMTVSR